MTTPNVLLLAVLTGILHAQGPLTPSGPPEATMKTLDQIEPRTPISSLPYTISQSGSYYFTGNLQFTANSGDAITITASNVTIDLMGFTLSSSAAVTGVGISVLDTGITIRCISIRNGAIAGNTTVTASGSPTTWSVNLAGFVSGISNACSHASFNDLIVKGTQSYGLVSFADYATVSNVHAEQNGGSGINTRSGSITNSTASLNGSDGIYCYFGSVTNSTASFNTTFDINAPNSAVAFCRFTTFSLTGSTRTGNYPSP